MVSRPASRWWIPHSHFDLPAHRPARSGSPSIRVARAGGAPDRRVSEVVQRVVRKVVLAQVLPGVGPRPRRHRVDLHDHPARLQLVLLHERRRRAGGGGVTAEGGHPRVQAAERLEHGTHLVHLAASLRIPLVEARAVHRLLLRDGPFADEVHHVQPEPFGELLLERERLGELEPRLQEQDRDLRADLRGEVHHHGALGLEGRRDRDPVEARALQRPFDDLLRVRSFEGVVARRQLVGGKQCLHPSPPPAGRRVYTGPPERANAPADGRRPGVSGTLVVPSTPEKG